MNDFADLKMKAKLSLLSKKTERSDEEIPKEGEKEIKKVAADVVNIEKNEINNQNNNDKMIPETGLQETEVDNVPIINLIEVEENPNLCPSTMIDDKKDQENPLLKVEENVMEETKEIPNQEEKENTKQIEDISQNVNDKTVDEVVNYMNKENHKVLLQEKSNDKIEDNKNKDLEDKSSVTIVSKTDTIEENKTNNNIQQETSKAVNTSQTIPSQEVAPIIGEPKAVTVEPLQIFPPIPTKQIISPLPEQNQISNTSKDVIMKDVSDENSNAIVPITNGIVTPVLIITKIVTPVPVTNDIITPVPATSDIITPVPATSDIVTHVPVTSGITPVPVTTEIPSIIDKSIPESTPSTNINITTPKAQVIAESSPQPAKKISYASAKKEIEDFAKQMDKLEQEMKEKYGVNLSEFYYEDLLPDELKIKLIEEFFNDKDIIELSKKAA